MRRKGEETISGYILVVGTLILVSLTIILAQSYLGDIQLPEKQVQTFNRSSGNLEEKIALLSERCWRRGGSGRSKRPEDCFHIKLTGQNGEIIRQKVEDNLEELPADNFMMPDEIGQDRKEFFISYIPSNDHPSRIMIKY